MDGVLFRTIGRIDVRSLSEAQSGAGGVEEVVERHGRCGRS